MSNATEGLTINQLAERNAEHVTTIESLRSQLTALTSQLESVVAENAALKDDYRSTPALRNMGWPKTPVTDAFLAEVRASGVEMYAENWTRKAIASGENKNHAYAYLAANFAAQLRQGGAV